MTVSSGLKCSELFPKQSQIGVLSKMLLESSTWRSTVCYLTWKRKVTKHRRSLFQLAPSTPRTEGIGCGFALTPSTVNMEPAEGRMEKRTTYRESMLPTPKANSSTGAGIHGNGGKDLQTVVGLLPTPAARDYKGANGLDHMNKDRPHMDQLPNAITHGTNRGLKLQPAFVEWMMGYPDKWTELID